MSDLLIQSANSMNIYRRALDVTGNNIANVNTEGYSRTRITVVENAPNFDGQNSIGQGARAVDVSRGYQNFMAEQLQKSVNQLSKYQAIDSLSTQLNQLFPQGESLLEAGFDQYFSGWQTLANDPTDLSAKSALLSNQASLLDRVAITNQSLKTLEQEVNNKISRVVERVNGLTAQLVDNNFKLAKTGNDDTQAKHNLLDSRDQLMKELNQLVDAKMFDRGSGIVEVYINDTKTPLITDNRAIPLVTAPNAFGQGIQRNPQLDVYQQEPGSGVMRNVGALSVGGELSGLMAFRDGLLNRVQDELGFASAGVMIASNLLHRQGADSFGQAGGDLFSTNGQSDSNFYTAFEQKAYPNEHNSGSATLSVNLYGANFETGYPYDARYQANPDLSALRPRTYLLERDTAHASGFRLSDQRTGEHITILSGDGSTHNPLQFEGLEVMVSQGTLGDHDRFEIRFGRDALQQAKAIVTDPQKIAYRAVGAGVGDNSIAVNIANLDQKMFLIQQQESPRSVTRSSAIQVGQFHSANQYALEAQSLLKDQIQQDRDASAGVSLDEEAQNMIQYQAMYQASAKVMQASRKLFALLRSIM